MKELKIVPPDGYCVDEKNSTFECIKFKLKELTYDDIAKELFCNNSNTHYIDSAGNIHEQRCGELSYGDRNRAISFRQCKRLLAINQLMNVAYYFNEIVDKDKPFEGLVIFQAVGSTVEISHFSETINRTGLVRFKTMKSAHEALRILGKETVRLAISL